MIGGRFVLDDPRFFELDLPSDVAASWSAALDATNDPADATQRVLRAYRGAFGDPRDKAMVLTALAVLNRTAGGDWAELGDRAEEAIVAGTPDGALGEQDAALLRDQLERGVAPDPSPGYVERTRWAVGDAFAYRAEGVGWVVLRTVGHYKIHDISVPVVDVLDWRGDAPPAMSDVADVGVRSNPRLKDEFNSSVGPWDRFVFSNKDEDTAFVLARKSDSDLPDDGRLRSLGTIRPARFRRHARTNRIVTWGKLDAHLQVLFSEQT